MDQKYRKCPYCKEEILKDAIKCRYCKSSLDKESPDHKGICPYCKEEIKKDALKCRYCLSDLTQKNKKCKCGDSNQPNPVYQTIGGRGRLQRCYEGCGNPAYNPWYDRCTNFCTCIYEDGDGFWNCYERGKQVVSR